MKMHNSSPTSSLRLNIRRIPLSGIVVSVVLGLERSHYLGIGFFLSSNFRFVAVSSEQNFRCTPTQRAGQSVLGICHTSVLRVSDKFCPQTIQGKRYADSSLGKSLRPLELGINILIFQH